MLLLSWGDGAVGWAIKTTIALELIFGAGQEMGPGRWCEKKAEVNCNHEEHRALHQNSSHAGPMPITLGASLDCPNFVSLSRSKSERDGALGQKSAAHRATSGVVCRSVRIKI